MSRIGKQPVKIPSGVEVSVSDSIVTFTKGKDSKELNVLNRVGVSVEGNEITFTAQGDSRADKAFWGTYRALANNIVAGLDKGFQKELEINGVGYRAALKGDVLNLQLGYSHPIDFPIPKGISIEVEKETKLTIKGSDKQQVGQVSAEIRKFRPPEPYKGKGIKYADERIIRKAGKTAKK